MTELPQRDSARLVIKIQRALHPPLAARQSDRDNIILNPTQRGVTSDRKLAAKQWRLVMEGCSVLPLQLRFVPCGMRRFDWPGILVAPEVALAGSRSGLSGEVLGSHAPLAASLAPATPPC
jgi:hypothetical protein